MKKTYKIDVDCANCANKMEEAANKTPGVKAAVVNFMTLKMHVEFEEGQDPKIGDDSGPGQLQEGGGRLRSLSCKPSYPDSHRPPALVPTRLGGRLRIMKRVKGVCNS